MRPLAVTLAFAFAGLLAAADTPALTLIVGNKAENSLAIVDPADGKVLGRVATGMGPHEVVVSADGKTAFVANYGTGPAPGNTLSVIDLMTQREIRKFDLSPLSRPHGLAMAGGKVSFPIHDTFWGARFGMLTDAYGINWMFNCELKK